ATSPASSSSFSCTRGTNGKRIVTCAGTPSAADDSWRSRRAPTAFSASRTATINAVRHGMLATVKKAALIVNPYSTHVTGERRIGLGAVNGRRFCFSAGLGFDGEAVRRLNELGRDAGGARPGDVAFARMVVKMLIERRGRWDPALEIDGVGRAAFVLVANCD